jgi:hypothetical protein
VRIRVSLELLGVIGDRTAWQDMHTYGRTCTSHHRIIAFIDLQSYSTS